METKNYPLISALCVTRAKPDLLHRAISCFLNQTYENKELIVVHDSDDLLTKDFVENFKQNLMISFYEVEKTKNVTLGYLRNYAIEKSNGEYVCQWDDDDWYHIARIEYLYETISMSGLPAAIMTQWLIFDSINNKAYVSHKRLWEGSLICKKNIIQNIGYDNHNIGEDTNLVLRLEKEDKLYHINDTPNLYVYIYHAKNTWNLEHWKRIFNYSFELSLDDSNKVKKVLTGCNNIEEKSLKIDELLDKSLMVEEDIIPKNKIPKIIHLIYKSNSIPDLYRPFYNRMKDLHPDWEIVIYDDSHALTIVKEYFPEILEIYQSYPCDVQRTDIFRVLIVYLRGGFYLDLDMYCLKDLEELRQFKIVLGEERTISFKSKKKWDSKHGLQVANYMFGSVPKHPFWGEVLLEGIKRSSNKVYTETDILKITGPWLLSEVYHNKKQKYNEIKLIRNKFRLCLNHCETISCHFGGYAAHFHSGSWRWKKDGAWHKEVKPQEPPKNKLKKMDEKKLLKFIKQWQKDSANKYNI